MSNYVVIARFDEATDKKIIDLQTQMINSGYKISEWKPHITIAAYENIDESLLCDWIDEFISNQTKRIEFAFNSMSILPPGGEHSDTAVLCLNPAHSKELVDFYYSFHEKYEEYCTGIGWYNSITHGNPIIHATIGIVNVKELQQAMDLILSNNVFGMSEITALELYTYPMALIKRRELHA